MPVLSIFGENHTGRKTHPDFLSANGNAYGGFTSYLYTKSSR
jgi:hypothetical protein